MKKLTPIILAIAAASVAFGAHAGERLDKIKSSKTIKIGFRDSSIPFSYLGNDQKPVGYSMDICYGVVDALKKEIPGLQVQLVPVTSATRIPMVKQGNVDLSCESATNNAERQKEVSFAPTTFVTATRFLANKDGGYKTLEDFKGQTVTSTAGTSNIKWLTQVNAEKKLGMNIVPANDHAGAFLNVQSGRAKAFFMDDVLLAGLAANSQDPSKWVISNEALTVEPYGVIEPKDDPDFKKLVDAAVSKMMKDGDLDKLYAKWFTSPIPPKNINMNLPMSEALKKAIANPTDSPDPATYK